MSKQNRERTNWLGVCLLVVGIAYLNRNLHWDFHIFQNILPGYFFSWQAILIIVGFCLLLFGRRGGLALMLIGAFFLFPHRLIHIFSEFHQWWPLALIVLGIVLLTRPVKKPKQIKN